MDSAPATKDYEELFRQKLDSANLNGMMDIIKNALNMDSNAVLNNDSNTLKQRINEQIVDKFIEILKEVQRMKSDHEEDEKFANLMALECDDIEFDIPAVYPSMTVDLDNDEPEIMNEILQMEQPQPHPTPIEQTMSPHDQLKALYAKEEQQKQNRQKVKLKLKVGYSVDIYSASKQKWFEGVIKEIKGDVLCVVYGRKMKWLKKDSKQLSLRAQQIKQAAVPLQ